MRNQSRYLKMKGILTSNNTTCFTFVMFSGQLWKLTSDKKLHNQNGDWLYSSKKWVLPREGKEGSIKDIHSGKVLSILSTMNVNLEDKNDLFHNSQWKNWKRSLEDLGGWFRLAHHSEDKLGSVRADLFLCAISKSRIIMAGKNVYLCNYQKTFLTLKTIFIEKR